MNSEHPSVVFLLDLGILFWRCLGILVYQHIISRDGGNGGVLSVSLSAMVGIGLGIGWKEEMNE